MTFEELQINHPVELEVSMNGKQTTLISSIEHKVGEQILLAPIKLNEKTIGFPKECFVCLYYIEAGKVYRWSNLQVKTVKYEDDVYHSVSLTVDAEVLNRRGAFRVYIGERVTMTSFTSNGPKKTEVLVKDISESGIAFLSEEEFTVGRTVRFQIKYGEAHTLSLTAQIVRIQEMERRRDKLYGCKFVEKESRLTNYLMKRQQEHQRQRSGR